MPFEEKLPVWLADGVETPKELYETGWEAGRKPPADYQNYLQSRIYRAFLEIHEKGVTKEEIEEALSQIKDASTTEKGLVMLEDTFNSQSKTKTPTSDALRRGLATKQDLERLADNFKKADAPPTDYPDGPSFFKITGGIANGYPVEFGNVTVKRTGSSATMMVEEIVTTSDLTSKSGRIFFRNKRDANSGWQPFTKGLTEFDRALIVGWANGVTDNRTVNAAPNTYAQGITREFKQGNTLGMADTESYLYLETRRPWIDDSAGATFQTAYGLTTGRVYTRTSTGATTWGKFKKEEQGLREPNLIPNPSGAMGLAGWTTNGFNATSNDPTYGSYFFYSAATAGQYFVCDSDPIVVIPGARFTIGATLTGDNAGAGANSYGIEVMGGGTVLAGVINKATTSRESSTFTVPAGVNSVVVRLLVYLNKPAAFRVITQVSLVRGDFDIFNNDADSRLLFQLVVNGKNDVKQAVISKSGTVNQAGSVPTFSELVTGVNSIKQNKGGTIRTAVEQTLTNGGQVATFFTSPPGMLAGISAISYPSSRNIRIDNRGARLYISAGGVEREVTSLPYGDYEYQGFFLDIINKKFRIRSIGSGEIILDLAGMNLSASISIFVRKDLTGGSTTNTVACNADMLYA